LNISITPGFMFGQVPFEKAIQEIRAIGYTHVELLLGAHDFGPNATPERVKEVGRILSKYGLTLAALLGGGPLASLDPSIRAEAVESFKRQIAIATAMGCDLITSEMNGGTSLQLDACLDAFKVSMEAICPVLEQAGIQAAFMAHPGDFIEDHDLAIKTLREIGSKNVGYLYSCPHTYILGTDAVAMLESAGDMLKHIHIADTFRQEKIVVAYAPEGYVNMLKVPKYEGVMNAHLHLTPGLGEVDFAAIFRTLKKLEYRGAISVVAFGASEPQKIARESYRATRSYIDRYVGGQA
jgi:myo-inositol catabolism protein IolH